MPVSPEMTKGPVNAVHDGTSVNGALRDDTLIDCNIAELYYGQFKAVRDVALKIKRARSPLSSAPQDAARVRSCAASTG